MTEEQLIELIDRFGLGDHRDDIVRSTRNAIFLELQRVTDENEIPIGHSKMGGNPDLPPDFQWYEYNGIPLTFMAQFRLSDLAVYDINHELPPNGMLYFFYEADEQNWGLAPEEKDAHRVRFLPDEAVQLVRHPHPVKRGDYVSVKAQPACKIELRSGLALTGHEESFSHMQPELSDDENSLYWKMITEVRPRHLHYLLGRPAEIQGDMRLECELTSQGIKWDSIEGSRQDELEKAAQDWQLLFQIDSDQENLDIMWGDVGIVYYWICKQDLQKRIFDHTWTILQCH